MSDYSRDRRRDGYKKYESKTPLPTRSMMGGRIYVGRLPDDIKEGEIEKVFGKYGHITEISLKGTYCFIQYDSSKSSKDAVHEMNGRAAFGDRIQVEHARNPKDSASKSRLRGGFGYKRYGGRHTSTTYHRSLHSERELHCSLPKRTDYRLAVTNLTTRCDKRDLRAVMEKAGEVCYTDAHNRALGEGIVEFASRKDMERALKKLDGLEINGKLIKLEIQEVRKTRKLKSKSDSRSPSRYKRSKSKSRSKSISNTKYRSKSRSKSLSLPKSLHSRSHSKSRSRSHSKSHSKRKRSISKRSASPYKIIPGHSKTRDTKSDDEEFEEAERNVKRRKQEKGSDSESDNELELMSCDIQPNESQNSNNQNGDILPTQYQDEEEVEEEIEEIVEEEVEVEVDEDDDDNECMERNHNTGAVLINGDKLLDY